MKLVSDKPIDILCTDTYIFMLSSIQDFKVILTRGKHIIRFHNLSEAQLLEIKVNGLRVFSFCQNVIYAFWSLLITGNFMTSNPPKKIQGYLQYLFASPIEKKEDKHTLFLKHYSKMEFPIRKGWEDKVIDLEPFIQSGDFLGGAMLSSGESYLYYILQEGKYPIQQWLLKLKGNYMLLK